MIRERRRDRYQHDFPNDLFTPLHKCPAKGFPTATKTVLAPERNQFLNNRSVSFERINLLNLLFEPSN